MFSLVSEKVCSKCSQSKPLAAFSPRSDDPLKLRAQCNACLSLYLKLKRRANPIAARERDAIYRAKRKPLNLKRRSGRNPDAIKSAKARYRERHREELRIKGRIYGTKNRDRIIERKRQREQTPYGLLRRRAIRQRRIAREISASGSFTAEQFKLKCEYFGWHCYLCDVILTIESAIIEHRIPLSRGGSNWISNIAPACESCNLKKNNKTEAEFRKTMRGVSSPAEMASEVLNALFS